MWRETGVGSQAAPEMPQEPRGRQFPPSSASSRCASPRAEALGRKKALLRAGRSLFLSAGERRSIGMRSVGQ